MRVNETDFFIYVYVHRVNVQESVAVFWKPSAILFDKHQ